MLQPVDLTAGYRDPSNQRDVLVLKCGHTVILPWENGLELIPDEVDCQRCETTK